MPKPTGKVTRIAASMRKGEKRDRDRDRDRECIYVCFIKNGRELVCHSAFFFGAASAVFSGSTSARCCWVGFGACFAAPEIELSVRKNRSGLVGRAVNDCGLGCLVGRQVERISFDEFFQHPFLQPVGHAEAAGSQVPVVDKWLWVMGNDRTCDINS